MGRMEVFKSNFIPKRLAIFYYLDSCGARFAKRFWIGKEYN